MLHSRANRAWGTGVRNGTPLCEVAASPHVVAALGEEPGLQPTARRRGGFLASLHDAQLRSLPATSLALGTWGRQSAVHSSPLASKVVWRAPGTAHMHGCSRVASPEGGCPAHSLWDQLLKSCSRFPKKFMSQGRPSRDLPPFPACTGSPARRMPSFRLALRLPGHSLGPPQAHARLGWEFGRSSEAARRTGLGGVRHRFGSSQGAVRAARGGVGFGSSRQPS